MKEDLFYEEELPKVPKGLKIEKASDPDSIVKEFFELCGYEVKYRRFLKRRKYLMILGISRLEYWKLQ